MSPDLDQLARHYGLSRSAIDVLANAIEHGNGRIAQFNHPELGGMGQWMPGMVMIGDMFNDTLKAKVAQVCSVLASAYSAGTQPGFEGMPAAKSWWPEALGQASMTGQQNDARYAYFPAMRRLAIKRGDQLTLYDTAEHVITGVGQQQSNDMRTLVFQTTRGPLRETDLRRIT